jgi:signal transduction histidine kinase
LLVAAISVFVITTLMTRTAGARYATQLLDAGRVAAERLIDLDDGRLESLRFIAATDGVAEGLLSGETAVLDARVRPIILNNRLDVVEIVDMTGQEVYGWQRPPAVLPENVLPRSGTDFSQLADVQRVLSGYSDESGDKRVAVVDLAGELVFLTIGPLFLADEQVGAVMVGSYLDAIAQDLSQNAVARVTLYDPNGRVLATTLGTTADSPLSLRAGQADYENILAAIQENSDRYQRVSNRAEAEVLFNTATVMGQEYQLAYGDWRLRGQSVGLFSVAFPTNYVDSPLVLGRNVFLLIFSLAFVAVFLIGLLVTSRITTPLLQLVAVTTAVGEGQLDQRTGIERRDEIGQLAASFDLMTTRLESRNQALLKQTSELETILNSITDGVLLLDTGNRIVTANVAAQKLLADLSHDFLSAGSLRELPLAEAVPDEQRNGRSPSLTAVTPQIKQHQIGNRVLTSLSTEVSNPDGAPYGTVIVMRDITQEVEAEHLKDAFITSISHELRTPLTVIKVYADLLLKTGNGHFNERQQQFMANIQKGSQQLEQHINQLLHISEIQAGTIRLVRQRVALPALAQAAVDNWEKRFQGKGIQLTLNFPDEPAWVSVDTTHMGWAIESLLSNAHNYTPAGGKVEVRLVEDGEYVHLAVSDDGIGIAAADQPHLFDRFFRAQNSINYEMRGVGLGLFIARSVVEMHDGQLNVHSELGQGSTFTITLPEEGS